MIIDCILERFNEIKRTGKDSYNAHDFYMDIVDYGKEGWDITAAMDYGDEEDIKRELCKYIVKNGYNKDICVLVNWFDWLYFG